MILLDSMGHMISDVSEDELHKFAIKIGLKIEWYHCHEHHPHYDLTTTRMRNRAIDNGATIVSPKEIARVLKRLKGDV
ncbi:MAG: DUF4031 domain-containing protein [Candidatus Peribacteraceae bacterium]|nr:DUF4031 domain-containing protein [Candidatus Peribacteraceae bacterium]